MITVLRKIVVYWLPVAALCAALFTQSSYPSIDTGLSFPLQDKLAHMIAYGVLAALFFRAGHATWPDNLSVKQLFWISVLFAGLYGVSDELHQAFVPARQADPYDLFADLIGSFIGAAGYKRWVHRRH